MNKGGEEMAEKLAELIKQPEIANLLKKRLEAEAVAAICGGCCLLLGGGGRRFIAE